MMLTVDATREAAMPGETGGEYHLPVLADEVIENLRPAPGLLFLDGTLGGGGHSERLLAAGARVIGCDQDPEAIAFAKERLAGYGERFVAVRSNFARAGEVLDSMGISGIDGALLDLGVSSWQLDTPERGFSFMAEGPLDMRMDPDGPMSAADLVNTAEADELALIFREFGEEPAARRIAAHLVRVRGSRPFRTTLDLARAVEEVMPRRGRIHPATRVFQALRIAVNRELDALKRALETLSARLNPDGRLAVISFHSLEDRIVKQFFRERSAEFIDRPEWPAPRPNPVYCFNLVTPKPVTASPAELARNARSRSAKLRAVERIHGSQSQKE